MFCKIDYLSFTIPSRIPFEKDDPNNLPNALLLIDGFLGEGWIPVPCRHLWESYKSGGFYHTRYFNTDTKASIFVGTVNRHVYCEFGGIAVDSIRTLGGLEYILQKVATRASRVDFAIDFETETRPSEFIVNNDRRAFKAGGEVFSEDGETCYVGSWKGERFARVYRYHEPHPRSKFLRAEVTLRGSYAKQGVEIAIRKGEVTAALAAHEPFQWVHPDWKPAFAVQSEIKSHRHDNERANTIRWLNGDIATCIANLHTSGFVDAHEWFRTFVLPKLPIVQTTQ
mgnify:CR=1 FL=1